MAGRIFQLISELAEFPHKVENPANLRSTFKITAEMRLKCDWQWLQYFNRKKF